MTLVFRVDASARTGLGHLSRCMVLAKEAAQRQEKSRFIIYGDKEAGRKASEAGFENICFGETSLKEQINQLDALKINSSDVLVLDFIHGYSLSTPEALNDYLDLLHERVKRSLLIDGGTPLSLRNVIDEPALDILVAPYAGEKSQTDQKYISLCGMDYYILPEQFRGIPSQAKNAEVNQILVTCGGSDPKEVTLLVMKALEKLESKLNVTIVTGPMFSNSLKEKISLAAWASGHTITLVDNPSNFGELMASSDLCISTSGLTKYELAATGTPSILVSIDEIHEMVNREFLKAGSAVSLGTIDDLKPDVISSCLRDLSKDMAKRQSMADAGRQLVDGKGASRILDALLTH